ncbi:MAG: lipoyl synthase [Deltaproteobacteria bacterium CG11_big_fil_rev_8_21_14_0_20_47_16]|nr:MAG: lipoyl synthase [Deltaproteobacteria bacterium CG11_big_fil_rev_8_21_14_0_20_47_16]
MTETVQVAPRRRLPEWLKKTTGTPDAIHDMKVRLRGNRLHTVCEEARCPNLTECFSRGVSTIMIAGDICTRSCRFCAVKTGRPNPLDPNEPLNTAQMVEAMALRHVVLTSVDRDDLEDGGAAHWAETIRAVRERTPKVVVEVLTPDFDGRESDLHVVCKASPHIFNHNMETVRRLTPQVRSRAKYDRSLSVLKFVATQYPHIPAKSGIMVGLGETKNEVFEALRDLKDAGCKYITIGQYLQPTQKHMPVASFIHPDEFQEYVQYGHSIGLKHIFAGPFVRSSYMADHQVEL